MYTKQRDTFIISHVAHYGIQGNKNRGEKKEQ